MLEHHIGGNRALEELFKSHKETGITAEVFESLTAEQKQEIIDAAASYEPRFYTVNPISAASAAAAAAAPAFTTEDVNYFFDMDSTSMPIDGESQTLSATETTSYEDYTLEISCRREDEVNKYYAKIVGGDGKKSREFPFIYSAGEECYRISCSFIDELQERFSQWKSSALTLEERFAHTTVFAAKASLIAKNPELMPTKSLVELGILKPDGSFAMPLMLHKIIEMSDTADSAPFIGLINRIKTSLPPLLFNELLYFLDENGKTLRDLVSSKNPSFKEGMLKHVGGDYSVSRVVSTSVDTHASSIHNSSDVSAVKLFRNFQSRHGFNLVFSVESGETPRKVESVARTDPYNEKIKTTIATFATKVNEWIALDDESLKLKLPVEDRDNDELLKSIKFNLKTVQRLIVDVIEHKRFGTYFNTPSSDVLELGLKLEELLAFVIDALDDTINLTLPSFEAGLSEEDKAKKTQEAKNDQFLTVVRHLKMMRRGYNDVDDSSNDKNICLGGSVNMMASALVGIHKCATVILASDKDYIKDLNNVINQTLSTMLATPAKNAAATQILRQIIASGRISREHFDTHLKAFVFSKMREIYGDTLYAPDSYLSEIVINKTIGSISLTPDLLGASIDLFFAGIDTIDYITKYVSDRKPAYLRIEGEYSPFMQQLQVRNPELYAIFISSLLNPENFSKALEDSSQYLIGDELSDMFESTPLMRALLTNDFEGFKRLLSEGSDLEGMDHNGRKIEDYINASKVFKKYKDEIELHKINKSKTPLMLAIQNGSIDEIRALLANEALDLNALDYFGRSALMYAVEKGDVEIVRTILGRVDINLSIVDKSEKTALIYAIDKGDDDVVKAIVEKLGGEVHLKDKEIKALFMYAVKKEDVEIVRVILAKPEVDVNFCPRPGKTALMYAIEIGNIDIAQAILAKEGVVLNLQDRSGKTALMCAVERESVEIVRAILAKPEVVVNLQNNYGETALMRAIAKGKDAIALAILAKEEVEVNLQDIYRKTALMYAVEEGNIAIALAILASPRVDVNIKDDFNMTALMRAIAKGNDAIAQAVLASPRVDVNIKDDFNMTALMLAIEKGNDAIALAILASPRVDVNIKDERDKTALMLAIEIGNVEIVREILAKPGVDLNLKDRSSKTALMSAIEKGNIAIVKAIVEKLGEDLHLEDKELKVLFMFAVEKEDVEILRTILAKSEVDVNINGKWGKTALMYAVEKGNIEIVQAILATPRVKVNLQDDLSKTALMFAIERGNIEIVQAILAKSGVNLNLKDRSSKTALMYAIEKGNIDILRVILAKEGVDFNLKDRSGKTALMYAVEKEDIDILLAILNTPGVDFNLKDNSDKTALMYAIEKGNIDILRVILAKEGVDFILKDDLGETALMRAIRKGDVEILRAIFGSPGFDVNLQDDWGKTALMYAVQTENIHIVREILANSRVDVNLQDKSNATALMYALEKGNVEIIKAIVEKMPEPLKKLEKLKDDNNPIKRTWLHLMVNGRIEEMKAIVDVIGPDILKIKDWLGNTALMRAVRDNLEPCAFSLLALGAEPYDLKRIKNKNAFNQRLVDLLYNPSDLNIEEPAEFISYLNDLMRLSDREKLSKDAKELVSNSISTLITRAIDHSQILTPPVIHGLVELINKNKGVELQEDNFFVVILKFFKNLFGFREPSLQDKFSRTALSSSTTLSHDESIGKTIIRVNTQVAAGLMAPPSAAAIAQ